MFTVGMKVECVLDDGISSRQNPPRKGGIYIVTGIETFSSGCTLHLLGHPAPETPGIYAGWNAICFRPVVERKASTETGFAILDDIRRKATKKRKAGANA